MAVFTVDPFDAQMPFPLDLRYRKADLNARNAIPANARFSGMPCWVEADRVLWVLDCAQADVANNANWKQMYPATGGAIQNLSWSSASPSGGADGDIWFRPNGDTVELWYRVSGSWGMLGSWATGGGITATLNNALNPFGETSATLDSEYPSAAVGDIVYTETGQTKWKKLATGKWNRSALDIV